MQTSGSEPIEVIIGQRIRDYRKALGLSQSQLGESFGKARGGRPITRASISLIECGQRSFTISDLIRLSDVLEVQLADLLNLSPSTGGIAITERETLRRIAREISYVAGDNK